MHQKFRFIVFVKLRGKVNDALFEDGMHGKKIFGIIEGELITTIIFKRRIEKNK